MRLPLLLLAVLLLTSCSRGARRLAGAIQPLLAAAAAAVGLVPLASKPLPDLPSYPARHR